MPITPNATSASTAIACGSCAGSHPTVGAARACAGRFFAELGEHLSAEHLESGGAVSRRYPPDDDHWGQEFGNDWHQNRPGRGEPACDWVGSCAGPGVAVVQYGRNLDPVATCPVHAEHAAGQGYPVHTRTPRGRATPSTPARPPNRKEIPVDTLATSNGNAPMPAGIAQLAQAAADFLGITVACLFIADHTHEELSEGAYSLAYEGDYDWPFRLTEAAYAGTVTTPAGWHLEAEAGWYLAAYPERKS